MQFKYSNIRFLALTALTLAICGTASAGVDVDINIGVLPPLQPPTPIYVAPATVLVPYGGRYLHAAPVYIAPRPVYVPAPSKYIGPWDEEEDDDDDDDD